MYKPVQVNRKDIYFRPDTKRVLARFFSLGDERSIKVIHRVLQLSDEKQKEVFGQVLRSYSQRHRSIVKVFERNFDRIRHLLERLEMPTDKISMTAKLLIGSYLRWNIPSNRQLYLIHLLLSIQIRASFIKGRRGLLSVLEQPVRGMYLR
ncbi:hypothetical protein [Sphingobacterium sp. IITKGP-BTPF85]|uniref:hypothetical protein n=1 Tax=Sphingobacterium sp. IITKGP-BTPF85 TaxID=1338009 RepID=UPI0029346777|nr:hypothetical protein [Sphingobacterium sp. IITKGP-BTPF85]